MHGVAAPIYFIRRSSNGDTAQSNHAPSIQGFCLSLAILSE